MVTPSIENLIRFTIESAPSQVHFLCASPAQDVTPVLSQLLSNKCNVQVETDNPFGILTDEKSYGKL